MWHHCGGKLLHWQRQIIDALFGPLLLGRRACCFCNNIGRKILDEFLVHLHFKVILVQFLLGDPLDKALCLGIDLL